MSRETYKYKRQAISAAKALEYPSEVISRLQEANTDSQIETIMRMARKGGCEA